MTTLETLREQIQNKANQIRELKAAKADAATLKPHVDELMQLKEQFAQLNGGVPFDPPKEKKAAAPAPAPAPAAEGSDGPSKKQLNKEKKKAAKEAAKSAGSEEKTEAPAAPRAVTTQAPPQPAAPRESGHAHGLEIFGGDVSSTILSRTVAAFLNVNCTVTLTGDHNSEPFTTVRNGNGAITIFGDNNIARYIARSNNSAAAGQGALSSTCVDQWLEFTLADFNPSRLRVLNDHLSVRTYMVGYDITLADIAVFAYLQRNGFTASADLQHLTRWHDLCAPHLSAAVSQASSRPIAEEDELCPPLEGAVEGEVVTRFPPEPSGYLHIGHCKAVLLNNYYARRYKGKLIIRFDDTNPSKEKEEFEESIIRDLESLDVHGDIVSHTSDHFDLIADMARKMIREGKAFMDDTPQEQMREERGNMIDSRRRDTPVEENLRLFESMYKGEEEGRAYCLRAKINMQSENGTLRDPVLYRYNDQPHHMTGSKYKAYPTYDFACPIVDSIEGVTHAMRTTEYNDRDEQYRWLQNAMGLRPVHIHGFARMNYVYTLLSKRKLTWFVDNGYVESWADPRFPTIQGVVRRGIAIPALKKYILSQGASRRITNMEWDSFWAINKQYYEPIAPRYMAVFRDSCVRLHLTNAPEGVVAVNVPIHPKNVELGERVLRRSNVVLLEGADAETLELNEKLTLLRWGNVIITNIEKDDAGHITRLQGELSSDTDYKKTKKLTWLADVPEAVPVQLVEFDHLITKEKIEEEEDFKQFIRPVTKAETAGLGDPCLRTLRAGDVIQLERRGFFRCDRPYLGPNKPCVLFMIPDGKTRAMSTLSGALTHR